MGFSPNDNTIFKGLLSYNKLYGENTSSVGNSQFDWIVNEAAGNDNALNVKEVYWLYMDDKLYGADIPWTVSVGRRPSTDGLGINLRADQERKSALSHTVNVEFDGASAKFTLDKLTGVEGMWLKFCAGRGLTNAKLRFSEDGLDFTDNPALDSVSLKFIAYVLSVLNTVNLASGFVSPIPTLPVPSTVNLAAPAVLSYILKL